MHSLAKPYIKASFFACIAFSLACHASAEPLVPLPFSGYEHVDLDITNSPEKSTFQAYAADGSFKNTLLRWGKDVGWNVSWELPSEYKFKNSASFGPKFLSAVDGLCSNLTASGTPTWAWVYPENKTIRILSMAPVPAQGFLGLPKLLKAETERDALKCTVVVPGVWLEVKRIPKYSTP